MRELVSGADTVDFDEMCAVVSRGFGVCDQCDQCDQCESAKRGKGKGESVRSVKRGRGAKVCGA